MTLSALAAGALACVGAFLVLRPFIPEISSGVRAIVALRAVRSVVALFGHGFLGVTRAIDWVRAALGAFHSPAAIAAACLAALSAVPVAFAAEATASATHVVVVPWGDWLASALAASGGVVAVMISWALRGAPAALRAYLTNDAITAAAHYVIATQIGLVRGKTVEIPVANDLIVMIADRLVESEPLVARWAGERLEPLIVAELSRLGMIPAEASAADLGLLSAT